MMMATVIEVMTMIKVQIGMEKESQTNFARIEERERENATRE
jgi:hypothetical protein